MVTWALFQIRATGKRFYFYNTHFPHRREDAEARLRCARLIRERIGKLPKDVPFILSGDFNSPAGSDPYQFFTDELKDAWTTAAHRFGQEGTMSQFGGATGGARIIPQIITPSSPSWNSSEVGWGGIPSARAGAGDCRWRRRPSALVNVSALMREFNRVRLGAARDLIARQDARIQALRRNGRPAESIPKFDSGREGSEGDSWFESVQMSQP
jgi:hypothetical protein